MAITKLPTSRWWNREPAKPAGDAPVQSTVVPLVKSTDAAPGATPAATSPATDPSPPPNTPRQFAPENVPETVRDLLPLTILTDGDAAVVATGLGYREWTNQDFAREFLHWVAREYPDCAGKKISASDIDVHFLPRFRANTGRIHLALGSLLRGLGKVTEKTERSYVDWTGAQRELVEYRVPKVRRA